MDYFREAYRMYDGWTPGAFSTFCKDCDEEIAGHDPVFVDFDGDVDEDGRSVDASTYLCEPCGVQRGYKTP